MLLKFCQCPILSVVLQINGIKFSPNMPSVFLKLMWNLCYIYSEMPTLLFSPFTCRWEGARWVERTRLEAVAADSGREGAEEPWRKEPRRGCRSWAHARMWSAAAAAVAVAIAASSTSRPLGCSGLFPPWSAHADGVSLALAKSFPCFWRTPSTRNI